MSRPTHGDALGTQTTSDSHSLIAPAPFVAAAAGHTYERPGSGYLRVSPADGTALNTRTGTAADGIVSPAPFVAVLRNHGTAHGVGEPFRTMAAGGHHHALVIPYRRANKPTTTDQPLHTMATRDSGALVHPAVEVDDCYFRMLKPREQLRAQRFPDSYVVLGNVGEQTMQAGNAVSANVAQWLGGQVFAALEGRSA